MDSITIPVEGDTTITGALTQNTSSALQTTNVYLIQFNQDDSSLSALDSTRTDASGNHEFDVPMPTVYTNATPDSATYPNEMPTSYDGALTFQTATPVNFTDCDIVDVSFSTTYGTNPGGPGFIGGSISQGAGKNGPGDPMGSISCKGSWANTLSTTRLLRSDKISLTLNRLASLFTA